MFKTIACDGRQVTEPVVRPEAIEALLKEIVHQNGEILKANNEILRVALVLPGTAAIRISAAPPAVEADR